jgi:uncharacterized protein YebE (UPF0316 family)
MTEFLNSGWFDYLLLPLMIFIARICDVTIGTLRIIFVSKGNKLVAPILGFFEVLIWIIAITRIIENLDNPVCYVAYAAGFATGNYIGLLVEERLAVGVVILRIITTRFLPDLVQKLNAANFGATIIEGDGSKGKVSIILSVVQRNHIKEVLNIIDEIDPDAFYSVEDTRIVNKGIFPLKSSGDSIISLFRRWRRGI